MRRCIVYVDVRMCLAPGFYMCAVTCEDWYCVRTRAGTTHVTSGWQTYTRSINVWALQRNRTCGRMYRRGKQWETYVPNLYFIFPSGHHSTMDTRRRAEERRQGDSEMSTSSNRHRFEHISHSCSTYHHTKGGVKAARRCTS